MSDTPALKPVAGLSAVAGLSVKDRVPPPPPRRRLATAEPEPVVDPKPARKAAKKTATKPVRAKGPSDQVDQPVRGITLSLPLSLATKFRDAAHGSGRTQADMLMDVLVDARDALPGLVEDTKPRASGDDLFVRVAPRTGTNEPLVPLPLRLLGQNIEAIDTLVTECGAQSRSQMCALAMGCVLD